MLNGSLTSNGQVFLINASGIVFGQGSMVDVAGLTASTLDLGNRSFMAGGDMAFSGSSSAAVTNAGTIRSSGDVFLIGFQVSNSGSIRAPLICRLSFQPVMMTAAQLKKPTALELHPLSPNPSTGRSSAIMRSLSFATAKSNGICGAPRLRLSLPAR